ncbi:MAG TPA: hypothetical protein VJ695_07065 [Nitrososphaera sp.]|nr:hypothetical protein [Nitrososphaera sp.]
MNPTEYNLSISYLHVLQGGRSEGSQDLDTKESYLDIEWRATCHDIEGKFFELTEEHGYAK